jgi:integrase
LPRERTKNNTVHVLPLSVPAIAILQGLPRTGPYVFGGHRAITGLPAHKLKIKLPAGSAPWVLHDLRRTVASGMARLGVAPHVCEAVLNHKSGTIRGVAAVYNRYSYDTEKRAALDAWARQIDSVIGGNVVALRARG